MRKKSRLSPERESYWARSEDDDERGRPYRIVVQGEEDNNPPQRQQNYRQYQQTSSFQENGADHNASVLLEALSRMTEPSYDKVQVNMRLDSDVVDWIDSLGGARATRINQALRALMNLT